MSADGRQPPVKVGDRIRVCINADAFPGHKNPAFVGGEYEVTGIEDGTPLVDGPGGQAPIKSWVVSFRAPEAVK